MTLTYTRRPRVTLVSTRRPWVTLICARRPWVTLAYTRRPWVTLTCARRPRVTLTFAAGGQPPGPLFSHLYNTLPDQLLLPLEPWLLSRVVRAVIRLAAGSTCKIPAKGDPALGSPPAATEGDFFSAKALLVTLTAAADSRQQRDWEPRPPRLAKGLVASQLIDPSEHLPA